MPVSHPVSNYYYAHILNIFNKLHKINASGHYLLHVYFNINVNIS